MISAAQEIARASALTEGKRQAGHINRQPATAQLAELQLAFSHYKNKLLNALDSGDAATAELTLNQLISLRGTQTALRLQDCREHGILINKVLVDQERQRFYEDCAQLIAATQSLNS